MDDFIKIIAGGIVGAVLVLAAPVLATVNGVGAGATVCTDTARAIQYNNSGALGCSIISQTAGNGLNILNAGADPISISGSVRIGSGSLNVGSTAVLGIDKVTTAGTAPGAAGGRLELVCGTNAGTAKVIIYAGTSTTPVTIVDNIGGGVTGC